MQVLVCSNVTIHPLEQLVTQELADIDAVVTVANYDNVWSEAAVATTDFVVLHNEILNLTSEFSSRFLDEQYTQMLADHIELQIKSLKRALTRQDAPKIIATSLSPFSLGLVRINSCVYNLCSRYDRAMLDLAASVIDFGRLLSESGFSAAIDWASYYRYSAPYDHDFLILLARTLADEIRAQYFGFKKVLAVDMDNTLWGGILGEDGVEKLIVGDATPKGKCFSEVQRLISALPATGILLASCSKNNKDDVNSLFKLREMPLSLQWFSVSAINWQDKTSNLQKISRTLNLGLESLVFVDDSDFEIAEVSHRIPQVHCLQVPKRTFIYPYWFRRNVLSLFHGQHQTEEDINRASYYKTEQIRKSAKSQSESEADFIASLGLSLTIRLEELAGVTRVAQMTNKTNQFNLTTKRYSEENITSMLLEDDFLILTGAVADKFGDCGKTLLAIVGGMNTRAPYIDTFLMSCRVIGRGVEVAFMDTLLFFLRGKGCAIVKAHYIATQKNAQVRYFYDQFNHELVHESLTERHYWLPLANLKPNLKRTTDVKFEAH